MVESKELGQVSAPKLLSHYLRQFIGEHVTIETFEGHKISGTLCGFRPSNRRNHIPTLLLLETANGITVIRNWSHIKMDLRKMYVHVTSVTASSQKP